MTINVLDELLVSDVSSRPLSLEEIRDLGIQYDEESFQGFNFTLALTTESGTVEIDFPVLMPIGGDDVVIGVQPVGGGLGIPPLPGLELAGIQIEPVMIMPVKKPEPGEEIPPIPGVIVIPGRVAYLNQFFSVLLVVGNEAPNGTPLGGRGCGGGDLLASRWRRGRRGHHP